MNEPYRRPRLWSAVLALLTLAGCLDISGPDACTAEWAPGIVVTVERADSGEPVTDALATAWDGGFADSARTETIGSPERAEVRLAHERGGEYDVTVEKDGYEPWVRHDVEVDENECHVETVNLKAVLEPR